MRAGKSIRRRTFEVINATEPGDKLGIGVDYCIIALITTNVLALLLETVESIYLLAPRAFFWFEAISVGLFTVEYLLRLWSSPESPKFKGRWKFALRPLSVIDFLAILPFYAPVLGMDLRVVRILRAFRLLRLVKLIRYMRALDTILEAIRSRKHELVAANGLMAAIILMLATTMFFVEKDAQPDAFRNAFDGLWWAVATLTTIGYGDVYPITGLGKVITGASSILTLGLIALPTSILTAAIMEGQQRHLDSLRPPSIFCPYCQGDGRIDENDPGYPHQEREI